MYYISDISNNPSILQNYKSKEFIKLKCIYCNAIYDRTKHNIQGKLSKGHNYNFCSTLCYKYFKDTKVECHCLNCDTLLHRPKKETENNIFCSKSCSISFKNKNSSHSQETKNKLRIASIKNNSKVNLIPNTNQIKNLFVYKPCPKCGQFFETQSGSKERKYCSNKCRYSTYGGYRKNSGRSKSGYYNNIWCDSTYELAFVIWHLDHNIPFNRCTKSFEYTYNNTIHTYYPDFIKDGIIIEIKGYHSKSVDAKTNSVISQGYQIKVLYYNDIKHMIEYCKNKYNVDDLKKLYDNYKPLYQHNCKNCKKYFNNDNSKSIFCSKHCSGKYLKNYRHNL